MICISQHCKYVLEEIDEDWHCKGHFCHIFIQFFLMLSLSTWLDLLKYINPQGWEPRRGTILLIAVFCLKNLVKISGSVFSNRQQSWIWKNLPPSPLLLHTRPQCYAPSRQNISLWSLLVAKLEGSVFCQIFPTFRLHLR